MSKNILLIVASGKSSRFGGFPKAFCKMGDRTNVDNTIKQAQRIYDNIYIGVNRDTYKQFGSKIEGCEIFSIITGQGDAHSILKCLAYIKEKEGVVERVTVCWGDAVFLDSKPFEELMTGVGDAKVAVACAMDERPYAWFEVDADKSIVKSYFLKDDAAIDRGLHDQSLFMFDFDFVIKNLNKYRQLLNIPYENDERHATKKEMKLLYFFEYLYKSGYSHAKCVEVTPGKVLSFNTQDELKAIKEKIEMD